jgi:hypothetical protein
MKAPQLSPILFSLILAACGGSDDDGVTVVPDAATQIDAAAQIDAAPPAFLTGSLTNVTFQHVTVAMGDTTPVNDGCVTKIDSATFTAQIMPGMKPGQHRPGQLELGHVKLQVHGATIAGGPACTVSTAMFGAKGALTAQAARDPGDDPADPGDDVLQLLAPLEAGSPTDVFDLQLWGGFGVFANGFATGTFPIAGDELQFASCGVCTFLHTNVTQAAPTGDGDYFATGGSITITAVQ